MAEYYLISQLPSLDGLGDNSPVPITEEKFMDICKGSISDKLMGELKKITLIPPVEYEETVSPIVVKWNEGERNLRLALAKIRSDKMNKTFDLQNKSIPSEMFKAATTATEFDNPLEAEKYLLQYRLNFLETLRPMDGFSTEFIFYYLIRLKLILRIRQFDTKSGEVTYNNIYDSILSGDRLEALQ